MKNRDEMIEFLESEGIIKRDGELWTTGPKSEVITPKMEGATHKMHSTPFSKGLTKERDIEVKESLLAMQVKFLKHGKKWTLQRARDEHVEHIILSTQPVKSVQFVYQPPEKKEESEP